MAYSKSNEKTFNITDDIKIVCYSQGTSYGFRHVATLKNNYEELDHKSVSYYNRTWESFTYESVLNHLVEKTKFLSKEEKAEASQYIKDYQKIDEEEVNKKFGMIGRIMALGNLFATEKKDQNSWKERMLKAGVNEIDFPENWNELDEEEKENRLNKVMDQMKG